MTVIGDSRRSDGAGPGILPLQHFKWLEKKWRLSTRGSVLASRVVDRHPEVGHWILQDGSVGDVINSFMWEGERRPIPGWSFMWPVVSPELGTLAPGDSPTTPPVDPVTTPPAGGGGGGGTTTPSSPTREQIARQIEDQQAARDIIDRFAPKGGNIYNPETGTWNSGLSYQQYAAAAALKAQIMNRVTNAGAQAAIARTPISAFLNPGAWENIINLLPGGVNTGPNNDYNIGKVTDQLDQTTAKFNCVVEQIDPEPIRPILDDDWGPDTAFKEIEPVLPLDWPSAPQGTFGILGAGTDTNEQHPLYFPIDPRLIAAHQSYPAYGSIVSDVIGKKRDRYRQARLQSLTRVIKKPKGTVGSLKVNAKCEGIHGNWLAWNIGQTGQNDAHGGLIVDQDPHAPSLGKGVVLGMASARYGGPFSVGQGNDKHKIGSDADGNPINMLHFGTNALFIRHGTAKNVQEDGPLLFEYEFRDGSDFDIITDVHLAFNRRSGFWQWWTTSALTVIIIPPGKRKPGEPTPTPNPPPTTPVPPPPRPQPGGPGGDGGPPVPDRGPAPPPNGGGTPGGDGGTPSTPGTGLDIVGPIPRIPTITDAVRRGFDQAGREITSNPSGRKYAGPKGIGPSPGEIMRNMSGTTSDQTAPRNHNLSFRETSFPSLAFRPQKMEIGAPDNRWNFPTPADEQTKVAENVPTVVRADAIGAQLGCSWQYEQNPDIGPYTGGVAPGSLFFFTPNDDAFAAERGLNTASPGERYIATGRNVSFAAGTPDTKTGGVKNGWSWKEFGGELIFSQHNPTPPVETWAFTTFGDIAAKRDDIGIGDLDGPVGWVAVGKTGGEDFQGGIGYNDPVNYGGITLVGAQGEQTPKTGLDPNAPVMIEGSGLLVDTDALLIQTPQVYTTDHYAKFGKTVIAPDGRQFTPLEVGPEIQYAKEDTAQDNSNVPLPDGIEQHILTLPLTNDFPVGSQFSYQVLIEESGNRTGIFDINFYIDASPTPIYTKTIDISGSSQLVAETINTSALYAPGQDIHMRVEMTQTNPNTSGAVRGDIQATIMSMTNVSPNIFSSIQPVSSQPDPDSAAWFALGTPTITGLDINDVYYAKVNIFGSVEFPAGKQHVEILVGDPLGDNTGAIPIKAGDGVFCLPLSVTFTGMISAAALVQMPVYTRKIGNKADIWNIGWSISALRMP